MKIGANGRDAEPGRLGIIKNGEGAYSKFGVVGKAVARENIRWYSCTLDERQAYHS